MMKSLDVLVDGGLVGRLLDKAPLTFVYSDDCLNGLRPSPFASVIPVVPGETSIPGVHAYFENLLPEGDQRSSLEDRHHVTSIFGLLATAGWDTVGAIVLQPTDFTPSAAGYDPLTWQGVADIIVGHGAPRESSRTTISGAQYKLLLSLDEAGNPLIPIGATPSTHILKPDIQRPGEKIWASAINETVMMKAAMKCGLPVANVQYIAAVKSCLVERFDRVIEEGRVVRIHQADLCQLLHIPSGVKYEIDGGPSFAACYVQVKATSTNAVKDCENLLKWVLFNLNIGNNDSHAKNISMLMTAQGARLAPFYDLMCTSIYPGFSNNFAFKIGSVFKPGEITVDELADFSKSIDVSGRYIRRLAKDMSEKINGAIRDAIHDLQGLIGHSEQVKTERLVSEVASNSKKLSARWQLTNELSAIPRTRKTQE